MIPSPENLLSKEQALVDEEHPWPGLASFREQDEGFFKGRDQDIEKLFALVNRERLTVLFGVSGLGKSSLLQAGLFPLLRQENILPVTIRFDFTDLSLTFNEQVFAAINGQIRGKNIEAPVHQQNDTLWEYFHRKDAEFWDARNRITIPFLCFDQFEEVFTLGREGFTRSAELKKFLGELADLVEGRCPECVKKRMDANPDESKNFNFSHHPYKLLFSLREDYLADMEGLRSLMPSLIFNRMRLLHMNGKQAMAVANQTQGRLMEHSVAESVVRLVAGKLGETGIDLEELRIEPALLSLVCRELNERRISEGAEQIDAQSVASNREQILEDFIDRSLQSHTPELRRFIEDKLITVSGYRNSEAYDNAVGVHGITAEALDDLVQCRILRVEERDGIKRIELIHDVLTGVLRKSRDQRQILERQRLAEQERFEAIERERKTNQALRVSKRRGLAFLVLTLIALASSGWGWWSWWDAKELHKKAQHALAMADFREGKQHYEAGNTTEALAHLAHAVRLDPDWTSSRALLVNLLQQRSWKMPISVFNHEGKINFAAFSPDGKRIVTASDDKGARLWDVKTCKQLGLPLMHNGFVAYAAFSPDGKRLVTASWDKTVRLWDVESGNSLGIVLNHLGVVRFAKFSPDGKKIATISGDDIQIWEAKTGIPVGQPINVFNLFSIDFSQDSSRLLLASTGGVRLWSVTENKFIGRLMLHKGNITSAQFSPEGAKIVTASSDKTARLWDAWTGEPLGGVLNHQAKVTSAQFSPDGKMVLTLSDYSALLWDLKTGKVSKDEMVHDDYVVSAQFSSDGKQLVTTAGDNSLRVWDTTTAKALGETKMNKGKILIAQFNTDGTKVLMLEENQGASLIDARVIKPLGITFTHNNSVASAQFSPGGRKVVTVSNTNSAALWDSLTGARLGEPMMHQGIVTSAEFSSDGKKIVTGSDDGSAKIWDAENAAYLNIAIQWDKLLTLARFSPDGERVATGSNDGFAQLWDAENGKPIGHPMTHRGRISSLAFNKEGDKLVTSSDDSSARVWDARTGESLGEPLRHYGAINSAQYSLNSTRILTASSDQTARLWDVQSYKPVGEIMKHQYEVISGNFSTDGNSLVTASPDYSSRLWDAYSGKPLGEAMWHKDAATSARFSPDDELIVTASKDKSIRIWDAKTGKPLSDFIEHEGTVNSAEFNQEGTRVVAASDDHTARIWDVFPVLNDDDGILPKLAEAVIGYRLTELSAIEPIENQLDQLKALKEQTEDAPLGEPTAQSFTRWLLSDPWVRTISPLSRLTVPEYIRQQIAAGRHDQIEQALPRHPLLQ